MKKKTPSDLCSNRAKVRAVYPDARIGWGVSYHFWNLYGIWSGKKCIVGFQEQKSTSKCWRAAHREILKDVERILKQD